MTIFRRFPSQNLSKFVTAAGRRVAPLAPYDASSAAAARSTAAAHRGSVTFVAGRPVAVAGIAARSAALSSATLGFGVAALGCGRQSTAGAPNKARREHGLNPPTSGSVNASRRRAIFVARAADLLSIA